MSPATFNSILPQGLLGSSSKSGEPSLHPPRAPRTNTAKTASPPRPWPSRREKYSTSHTRGDDPGTRAAEALRPSRTSTSLVLRDARDRDPQRHTPGTDSNPGGSHDFMSATGHEPVPHRAPSNTACTIKPWFLEAPRNAQVLKGWERYRRARARRSATETGTPVGLARRRRTATA